MHNNEDLHVHHVLLIWRGFKGQLCKEPGLREPEFDQIDPGGIVKPRPAVVNPVTEPSLSGPYTTSGIHLFAKSANHP
jgi:hypothetical protein